MAVICDANVLASGAKCFSGPCLSSDRRKAVLMYLLAKEASALGLAIDYSANVARLLKDSRQFQGISPGEIEPAFVEIYHQEAIQAAATLPATANGIIRSARCFECIGNKDAVLLYLWCALSQQR